jgi:capsular polysaccharide export protein
MSATRAIRSGGFPYHLALLQLEHDANFQAHSPFKTTADYIQTVIRGFAVGAPAHHHLVFKSHPLEDGRVKIRKEIRQAAKEFGISDRVHFVRGGKLASLLDPARSVVTVNSTAAQQALWRGLPLKAFGAAVYGKPEFVSDQPMEAFFADPERPDTDAYADYRQYMLETSQVPGGFYSSRGRKQAMRRVVDMLLAVHDPYDALTEIKEAPKQQLRLVR